MAEIKGSLRRTILSPGYHISPEYDLPGLRLRMYGSQKKDTNVVLPLTSMIDMFSTLVIVLLLNFSATGEVFFVSKDMTLPEAENAQPLEGLPLISISSEGVSLDAEKVGDNPLHIEESDQNLPKLKSALQKIRILEETTHPDKPFVGKVNIQADEGTAVIYIKRVMNTLISEGWTQINFATNPAAEPPPGQ